MSNRIDLTPLLNKKTKTKFEMTSPCRDQIVATAQRYGVDPELCLKVTGGSVYNLATSFLMNRKWYKAQTVHKVAAFQVQPKDGEQFAPIEVYFEREAPNKWVIYSDLERSVPENYEVERLIEETKAQEGIRE